MKTTFIYFAFFYLSFQVSVIAQLNPCRMDGCLPSGQKFKETDHNKLMPVYFNYTKRQLFYNGNIRMNGNDFLNLCRGINDQQVQHQIARYDHLTRNKKKLLGAMIACGVGGYITMMASMVAVSGSGYYNQGGYTAMGIGAASLFIATPILAISTGIPHQKRKEVVFRDLPAAYNFYVESNNK